MKIKLILLIGIYLLQYNNLIGKNADLKNENLKINTQNIDTSNIVLNKTILELKNRLDIIEKDKLKETTLPNTLQFAAIIVASFALLLTVVMAFTGWLSYVKIKEAQTNIDKFEIDAQTKLNSFNNEIIQFKEEYKERINQFNEESRGKINSFEKDFSLYINEIKKNIDNFDKQTKNQLFETDQKLLKFKETTEIIFKIEKTVSSNQTYLYQGLESLFDLFFKYANSNKEKEILELILVKRAINNLYSFNDKDRFSGITTLGAIGKMADIIHLNNILVNPSEIDSNKLLAADAISLIKSRLL